MFCDGCGAALQTEQSFCSRCGKEIKAGLHVAWPRRSRVHEHIRLLGILWLALSAINAAGGAVLLIVANTVFVHIDQFGSPPVPKELLQSALSVIGILVLLKAAAGFAAGWGLLQREPWARMLTLIVAFISLFNVPFGTALGIYSLWVLLPTQSERDYEEQVKMAA